jgi:hypothetical protein
MPKEKGTITIITTSPSLDAQKSSFPKPFGALNLPSHKP